MLDKNEMEDKMQTLKKGKFIPCFFCCSFLGAILSALLFTFSWAQEGKLPQRIRNTTTLDEAINRRMSVRAFQQKAVAPEKLSWLLWLAGKCRIAGKVPGNIAVRWEEKNFLYNEEAHGLLPTDREIPQLRMFDSPVQLYLLSRNGESEENNPLLWMWRGMAGQAVYLAAPALGLGTVTIRGVGFPIGYPKEEMSFQNRPQPEESNLPPVKGSLGMALEENLFQNLDKKKGVASLSPQALSQLLWSAYGFSMYQESSGRVHRTVPSARGRYPMAVLAIKSDGVYQYIPEKQGIELLSSKDVRLPLSELFERRTIRQSPCLFLFLWDSKKLESRDFALYEAGAMAFNMQLVGNALNLSLYWDFIPNEENIAKLLDLKSEGSQVPLLLLGVEGVSSNEKKSDVLKDGRYVGEETTWPGMKVEVTVVGGRIQEIRVLEDLSSPEFSEDGVADELAKQIVAQGSLDIDGISGATLSSNNLKKAIKAALEKAR